jgi:AcrR family transcriptional regulator
MVNQEPGTRDRILDAATRLFAEKGYGPTSIAEILRVAGANSGSLYHFFPTKQDLLVAVLDRYLTGIGPMLFEPTWRGVEDPVERVFRLLARYREYLISTGHLYGCPIGSIALELHEPDPVVREKLAANFSAWTDAVERCFREAGDRLPAEVDARQLAAFTLSVMEGAVMQARTQRGIEPFDASVARLRDYIARLEKSAASGPLKKLQERFARSPGI